MASRLKDLRKEKKVTLVDIEKETGIKRSTYSDYENGIVKTGKLTTWKKLAEYFGVSVSELMDVDDYMKSFVETMQNFDSKYEDDLKTQLDRLSKSKYKSFELPIITNALDLILTSDEKYFVENDINIELGALIGTLNLLIHNRDDEFNVDNPEFGKEEDIYKAVSETFNTLLEKIKEQNKKTSDDKPETEG